jgi:hypothetical protein
MNKQARAARAAAEARALDAALDREIERAVGPLRATPAAVEQFEAASVTAPLPALSARRAAGLVRSLRRAVGAPEATSEAASFGDLLRVNRERARLDVGDVARRLHVHRDYLAGIESGARSPLALGPDGARRLVTLLGIPPGAAAVALEAAMRSALTTPYASFSARMKRGVPRETRKRILEQAVPKGPEKAHVTEWREMIDAVGELEP